MTMGVNLIPGPRLAARQRARAVRMWVRGGAAFCAAVVALAVAAQTFWGGDPVNLAAQHQMLVNQTQEHSAAFQRLNDQLLTAQRRVEANRAVTNQPDWSVLLAALAQTLDERVMLHGCRFQAMPVDEGDNRLIRAKTDEARDDGFTVEVTGMGENLSAVSAYVLRLEGIDVFDEVRLIATRSEPITVGETRQAIAFRVECFVKMNGKGGGDG